ncbi:acyl-CoA/acyl-ACP dehydrogenase [Streptomyces sp. WMMC500]|uniref:acyl-CoA dehydrogenase family protein n=1 Tax=Streptomyces sp. WMMC500 TaxID=3015154 RepID=UPI00248B6597|nr:acyl-CoA dehydrogenase family protein [Streptomyces sp. WMMC500]WBB60827.1 acyl-CoA/acyl-ACP dehydrogenase [Streptomyces sp. WMMC500]
MDLTLTEDQELIRTTARDLLESRSAGAGARAMADEPAGYSAALWKEMVELGWTGLALPEAHGGVGAGFLELCLVVEEMGRSRVPSPFLSTAVCCGLPLARFGTAAQQARWLAAIARGRVMSAVPGRWDGTGGEIEAAEREDGFVLDGTALFVPYAHAAEDLLVVPREGPALLVDTASPGLAREPLDAIGAERPHRVRFDGVAVPRDRALTAGRPVAEAIDAYGAAATCAAMVGAAQRVLDMTVAYAAEREQFGRPIGAFQAVQHHCANMAVDVLSSRFMAYEAIWRLSAGLDAAAEVSMAKAWVSEACRRVCDTGHQVHGAIGFTYEHDLHLVSGQMAAWALAFGDADHHWDRVADHLEEHA